MLTLESSTSPLHQGAGLTQWDGAGYFAGLCGFIGLQTDEQTEHKTLLTGCINQRANQKKVSKGIMKHLLQNMTTNTSLNKAVKHEQNEEKRHEIMYICDQRGNKERNREEEVERVIC